MDYLFGKILARCALMLSVLGLLTTFVFAQGGTGDLTGVVEDPTGAVVHNATVTLATLSPGKKLPPLSNQAGIYLFAAIPPGGYTIESSPKVLKGLKVSNVFITVGATATQDLKLEVGQSS